MLGGGIGLWKGLSDAGKVQVREACFPISHDSLKDKY